MSMKNFNGYFAFTLSMHTEQVQEQNQHLSIKWLGKESFHYVYRQRHVRAHKLNTAYEMYTNNRRKINIQQQQK